MTRTDLAPPQIDTALIDRLTCAVEALAATASSAILELKAFTPAEAAALLSKTENWVIEAIQEKRIPATYIGKSPRMTAAQIRWVLQQGESSPNKYSLRPLAA